LRLYLLSTYGSAYVRRYLLNLRLCLLKALLSQLKGATYIRPYLLKAPLTSGALAWWAVDKGGSFSLKAYASDDRFTATAATEGVCVTEAGTPL
jgi:hypothetical protein